MIDSNLINIISTALETGLVAQGFVDPDISQGLQPQQQGAPSLEAWFIHKITMHKHGSPQKVYKANLAGTLDLIETRVLERTYQITALKKMVPEEMTLTERTADDMAEIAAAVMGSQAFIDALKLEGIGILRITDVRTPYFTDQHDQNDISPNFDFTITYNNQLASIVQPVVDFTTDLHRV